MLSEIAEHPTDDKLRAVYADLLQERGDPRGELIALQLAGRDAARVKTLLSAYSQHWVGGLGPVLGEAVFERGFLSRVELTEAPASGFAALVGDPIWATVKQITVFKMLPVLHELFAHPVMRSLERVIADDGSRKRNVPFGAARARRH